MKRIQREPSGNACSDLNRGTAGAHGLSHTQLQMQQNETKFNKLFECKNKYALSHSHTRTHTQREFRQLSLIPTSHYSPHFTRTHSHTSSPLTSVLSRAKNNNIYQSYRRALSLFMDLLSRCDRVSYVQFADICDMRNGKWQMEIALIKHFTAAC